MKEKEFLEELKKNLFGIPKEDIDEVIEDYKEHFRTGRKNGRQEEEISNSLGSPRSLARDIKRELKPDKSDILFSIEEVAGQTKKYLSEGFKKTEKLTDRNPPKAAFIITLYALGIVALIYWVQFLLQLLFEGIFGLAFGLVLLYFTYKILKNNLNLNDYLRRMKVQEKKRKKEIKHKDKQVKNKSKNLHKKRNKVSAIFFGILLGLFVVIGYCLALSGILTGISVMIAGLSYMVASIMMIALPGKLILESLLFAGVFLSLAIMILGAIVLILFLQLTKLITKMVKNIMEGNE